MKLIIIEDELFAAKRLEKLIKELHPNTEVLALLHSVEDSISYFNSDKPQADLLLMDIQLSDGISFEIFNQITITAPIIFTTAYDEYALKAFKQNSIDYLLKPIDKEELKKALDKYFSLFVQKNNPNPLDIDKLLTALNIKTADYKTRFLIKSGDKFTPLQVSDIAYIFTSDKGVYALTTQNIRYLLDYSLEEMEQYLNPSDFFRANRQYLIHLQSVEKFSSGLNGKLKLTLTPPPIEEVIISREKSSYFKTWIGG